MCQLSYNVVKNCVPFLLELNSKLFARWRHMFASVKCLIYLKWAEFRVEKYKILCFSLKYDCEKRVQGGLIHREQLIKNVFRRIENRNMYTLCGLGARNISQERRCQRQL